MVEYRDRPCEVGPETQAFLAIRYHTTELRPLKQQAKTLENLNKALKAEEKQIARLNKKNLKAIEREKAEKERRQKKCVQLNEKIKQIESQLRVGCKLKKANRLKEELEIYRARKEKVCAYEH